MSQQSVFIYEELELGPPEWTGLVSTEYRGPNGESEQGPQSVDVDAAIAWGRKKAKLVTVRLDDTHYSAGAVTEEGLQQWTDSVVRPFRRPAYKERSAPSTRYRVEIALEADVDWRDFKETLEAAGLADVRQVERRSGTTTASGVAEELAGRSLYETLRPVVDKLTTIGSNASQVDLRVVGSA